MAVIRANRESIDDRFSVLGFTVRSELPLYEIAVATEPELLRPDQRARRTARNFFTSRLQRVMASQRGEAVYMVPPEAVARFIGQPRLYFGLATYRESDRSVPVSLRLPDRGTMYVGLTGLSERGFRRSLRGGPGSSYGANGGSELGWGGDALAQPAPPSREEDRAPVAAGRTSGAAPNAPYSDGYSDELWQQPPAAAPAPPSTGAAPTMPPPPPAPTAQGLALRGDNRRTPTARPLLVSPYYRPENFWDALSAQARFFLESARWFLGVDDTTVMPHSAICQVRFPQGSGDTNAGTAFFIGPRLILTAAHVLYGQSEVILVPGKNGDGTGSANEPFGRFRVTSANWTLHPSYRGGRNHDFDLAVICVPAANAAPAGRYFDIVEELTQSRPEGVVVTGYAAWWTATTPIEQYVNDNIDPNKQHMMGGYIRELPTDDTFTYDLQTLGGTSGSPVYWIEQGATPRAHLVGVHVDEFDATTNLGCRLTPAKIAWIRGEAARLGVTVPFSLGLGSPGRARNARGLSVEDDDAAHDAGPIPDVPESAAQGFRGARGLTLTASEYPQANRFEPAHPGNYRAVSGTRTIDRIVIHITDSGANISSPINWFKNPAAKVSAHYVIGQDGTIVQMVAHNDVAWHAGAANGTSIGIEHVANTRGLAPTAAQMCASAALVTWLCDTYGIPADRQHILGHAEADGRTTHTACPNAVWDWAYYMDMIRTRTCYVPASITPTTGLALGLGRSRALSDDADADADDPDAYGIAEDEPVDDEAAQGEATAQGLGYARGLSGEAADYPNASRFVPAHPNNYRRGRRRGAVVDRIVIHITAGGPNIDGTIGWFQNGNHVNARTGKPAPSSAHYIVGRDGEVVQMVRNADTAYHASSANSRSIGIEHNGNKPSRRNRRDLPPTEPQYQASANLVAWLCAQYGIPADREHIRGHNEISPRDQHDCPTDYWDWDHYMQLVQAAAAPPAAAPETGAIAQGLGMRRYARAQELLTPFYDPSNPGSALQCTNDAFSQQREEWYVGVQDTSSFPHSAICFLRMTAPDGTAYTGTGFYIGRNRILTCAHNLNGMSTVQIVPGRNGAGTAPFGEATIDATQWRVAPRYTGDGNWDNDLAVIDNAPIEAPNGAYFRFLQATPASTMPLAVCGYSSGSNLHRELGPVADRNKQHLHGGHAQGQATPDTIDYDILAVAGASGSPVYTVRDDGNGLQAFVCGVHVTRGPIDPGTGGASVNRACFLTPAKLDWIEGRAASFSLGAGGAPRPGQRPTASAPRVSAQGLTDPSPVDLKVRVFIPSPAILMSRPVISDRAFGGDGRGFQYEGGTSRAEIQARLHFGSDGQPARLETVGTPHWGESTEYDVSDTEAVPGKPDWYRNKKAGAHPIDRATLARTADNLYARLGGDSTNGIISMAEHSLVTTFHVEGGLPLVTLAPDIDANLYVHVRIAGDRVQARVVGGHDAFPAYEVYANGTLLYSYNPLDHDASPTGLLGPGVFDVQVDSSYVDCGPASEYRLIGPVRIQSLGAAAHALADDGPSDYPVALIPQPDKNACWAASMAMLIAHRRQQSRSPESIINEIGGSLATSYGWDLLTAARNHYGFEVIDQPSNASIYHTPRQWAAWLNAYGPLWVVIVGAPHAVVVAGIRGNLDDPNDARVKILNPWDTRVAFDNDPIAFHPANNGYEDWLPFMDFATAFGDMAQPDYGNWRILHLPVQAVQSQSLSRSLSQGGRVVRFAPPPPPIRALEAAGERDEPIEPSRVAGARMRRTIGEAGASRWSLDQLDGLKSPATPSMRVGSAAGGEVRIALDDWPAVEGAPTPLPVTVVFRHDNGSLGDVRIVAGTPANLAYGVEVVAKIEDCADADGVARLRVRVDYRFRGLAQGNADATIDMTLRGDGRYERENGWRNAAPDDRAALSPAA
ncbi:MAG: N-acetylmuramoyl-L-alanine amidase [Xanthomonadales bacterium]|nr:N-acetylmuramoyl-L-alanine amidase [Xanthomonadales bacterium]